MKNKADQKRKEVRRLEQADIHKTYITKQPEPASGFNNIAA